MRSTGRLLLTALAGFATAADLSIVLAPGWAGAASPAPKSCPFASPPSHSQGPGAGSKCPYSGREASGQEASGPEGPKCPVSGETPRYSTRPAAPLPVRIDRT